MAKQTEPASNELWQVATSALLLVDRIEAMRSSGVLSESAHAGLAGWADRLRAHLEALPRRTAPNETRETVTVTPLQEDASANT